MFRSYCQKGEMNVGHQWLDDFEQTHPMPSRLSTFFEAKPPGHSAAKVQPEKIVPESKTEPSENTKTGRDLQSTRIETINPGARKEIFFERFILEEQRSAASNPKAQENKSHRDRSKERQRDKSRAVIKEEKERPGLRPTQVESKPPGLSRRRSSASTNSRFLRHLAFKEAARPIKRRCEEENVMLNPRKCKITDLERFVVTKEENSLDEEAVLLSHIIKESSKSLRQGESRRTIFNENTASIDFELFAEHLPFKKTPNRSNR